MPLRIVYGGEKQNIVAERNSFIRIRFVKETVDITIEYEYISYVESAASPRLEPTLVTTGGRLYVVESKMVVLTMIDTKVYNASTGTKSRLRP